jgi:hypothetical protein
LRLLPKKEFWQAIGRGVLFAFDLIPFIGRLRFNDFGAWARTSLQFIVSLVLSTLPIWAGVLALRFGVSGVTYSDALRFVTKNGEFLLLSAGVVSPIVFLATSKSRASANKNLVTNFPHGAFYFLAIIGVVVSCAIFITIRIKDRYLNIEIDHNMFSISLIIYFGSLFVAFTAQLHKNLADHVGATELNRPAENEYERQWDNRNA